MSDDDFKMGQQGLRWSPGMNRQDYDRGKADREDQAAAAANAPKTEISGPGFVGLVMAPILAIMYPVAGVVTVAFIVAAAGLTELMPASAGGVKLIFVIVVAVLALWPALKAEHKASEWKLYRATRSILRILWIGLLVVGALIGADQDHDFDRALRNAPPSTLFWTLVALALMLWLFPRFDRVFFPVRDSYAIKQEKKYAGMSEDDIYHSKRAGFFGRLRFTAAWLVGTIGVMALVPHASVALIALGVFVVCWVLRKKLFFRSEAARSPAT